MSRLDANGRWGTKMMTPEFQEQYDRRNEPKLKGRPTVEELTMIRDAIMYPHMLTIADKAREDAERSKKLFYELHVAMMQIIMDRITKELNLTRRTLRERNIKIENDEISDGVINHKYWCRGYESNFGIVRETLASEIRVRLGKYGAEILKQLRGEKTDGEK